MEDNFSLVTCKLALLCMLIVLNPLGVDTQTCTLQSGCYPRSTQLLDLTYPNRTVSVTSTCSSLSAGLSVPFCPILTACDATNAYQCNLTTPRNASYMFDRQITSLTGDGPNLNTFWQSVNTIGTPGGAAAPQTVTINLGDLFLIRDIKLVFISPFAGRLDINSDMRPQALSIHRRATATGPWLPWRYYSSSCARYFPGVLEQAIRGSAQMGPSFTATTPVCLKTFFAGDTDTNSRTGYGLQEVLFNPSREFADEYFTSVGVQLHYTAHAIQIQLVQPASSDPLVSFYSIADLAIEGHCFCNGHAANCTGQMNSECVCSHHTAGKHCDTCRPLYNNRTWALGTPSKASECQDCGCNGLAAGCRYDSQRGRGVCDNCTDLTAGEQCQHCVDMFYVRPNRPSLINSNCTSFNATSGNCSSPCVPCNCSSAGTSPTSRFSCDTVTGQCTCKTNVAGRACDTCKDGHWNLQLANFQGCQACDCNRFGTFNNSNLCDKINSTCVCKKNVQGARCESCKSGYFNMAEANGDGCSSCDCDLGGSLSQVCPFTLGQCQCRRNLGGRTCRSPFSGYFVPLLDHLTFEAERASNGASLSVLEREGHGQSNGTLTGSGFVRVTGGSMSIVFSVAVPRTFFYNVILRYESPGTSWSNVALLVRLVNGTRELGTGYSCDGGRKNFTMIDQQQLTANVVATNQRGSVNFGATCLYHSPTARYELITQFPATLTPSLQTLVDSIVLMPVLDQLSAYQLADNVTQANMAACYRSVQPVSNAVREARNCSSSEFSLMSELYEGAIPCQCSTVGSSERLCDGLGGQCRCRSNIIGLDCAQCAVNSYGFNRGIGCTKCDCSSTGSVRASCNETGLCSCHQNVTGSKCDSCLPKHYGLSTGRGCQPCVCHANYSLSESCVDTGQCPCKPGIAGLSCTSCDNFYFNLTTRGCSGCNCSRFGSSDSGACDVTTGLCRCKQNVVGGATSRCDTCKAGHYGLGVWGREGCLPCYCSGRSSNCSSSLDWRPALVKSTWNLLQDSSATDTRWTGVDESGRTFNLTDPTLITNFQAEHVMRLTNDAAGLRSESLFFVATSPYLGDKRGAYGQNLTFALTSSAPALAPYINSTQGDVILQGQYTTFRLVANLPSYPGRTKTPYMFALREDSWFVNSTAAAAVRPTYIQIQQTLAALKYLWIRAKFSNVSQATTDLGYAEMGYAVYNKTSLASPINNIESCVCPQGYKGEFCESCDTGYRRKNPELGLFSECIRCFCNNHETIGTSCNPDTGSCQCTDSTEGTQCERCKPGYYGQATVGRNNDCRSCMCPGNVIDGDLNVFARTCQNGTGDTPPACVNCTAGHTGANCELCAPGYYGHPKDPTNNGGRCSLCQCNGRATTCNTTSGSCDNCTSNTSGRSCESCATGYYGNALWEPCKSCRCNMTAGMTGDCDPVTGACKCRDNLTGPNCDECSLYAFRNSTNNNNNSSCSACDCHVTGSLSPACDRTTGQCACKLNVEGRRCDVCKPGYWSLKDLGCQACQCSVNGTANVTAVSYGSCDIQTGQCLCRSGITGLKCDECAKASNKLFTFVQGFYFGVYPRCELCGECYDNVATQIDAVAENISSAYQRVIGVWSTVYGNMTLGEVEPVLTGMLGNLTTFTLAINDTALLAQRIYDLSTGLQQAVDELSNATRETEKISQSISQAQRNLTSMASFNAQIPYNGTTIPSPSVLNQTLRGLSQRHQDLTRTATDSWNQIQNIANILQLGSSVVDLLRARAAASLSLTGRSEAMRLQAVLLANQTSLEDLLRPRLATVERGLLGLYVVADRVTQTNQATRLSLNETGAAITSTEALLRSKSSQTSVTLQQAEASRFNSTQALGAVQNTQAAVSEFKNMAELAMKNVTGTIELISTCLKNLRVVSAQLSNTTNIINKITSSQLEAQLRSVQSMSTEMNALTVPAEKIQALNRVTAATSAIANTAVDVTSRASTAARAARDAVVRVINSTQTVTDAHVSSQRLLTQSRTYNQSVATSLKNVTDKTSYARDLYSTTSRAIDVVVLTLTSTRLGYAAQAERVRALNTAALQSSSQGQAAVTNQAKNVQLSNDVQSQLGVRQALIGQQLSSLQAVKLSLDPYVNDVRNMTSTILEVQNELARQKNDASVLTSQVSDLENQLQQLIITLDQLNLVSSVNCANN